MTVEKSSMSNELHGDLQLRRVQRVKAAAEARAPGNVKLPIKRDIWGKSAYFKAAYSLRAAISVGISGSASFHIVKKSW